MFAVGVETDYLFTFKDSFPRPREGKMESKTLSSVLRIIERRLAIGEAQAEEQTRRKRTGDNLYEGV